MKQSTCIKPAKVAVVGAGFVGSTAAYAMMIDGVVSEISLIDANKEKAEGEALDLQHGMQFTKSTKIWAGDSYELVEGAQIVVLCAGLGQKTGESRTDLLKKNVAIFKDIVPKIVKHNKDCILLVVTNPLDVMTYVTWKLSGFDSCRVFGTGTVLDTARFRFLLGRHFHVSPKDITAYILGEHGDSEFAWLSGTNIAGVPICALDHYCEKVIGQICEDVKQAAYEIIERKGATYYAIGLVIAKIVRAIVLDQCRVLTVSNVLNNYAGVDDVCLGVPTIIRTGGICQRLDILLNEKEKKLFHTTADTVKKYIVQAIALL